MITKSVGCIKVFALCTVLGLTCLGITSCNEKTASTNSDATVVNVWTDSRHSQDVMAAEVEKYNNTTGKEKGIKIEYKVYSDDFPKVLELAHASMQAPELHMSTNSTFASKGWLIPVNDLPGVEDLIKDSNVMELRKTSIKLSGGKFYSLPLAVTSTKMVYNRDLFKKAGIVDGKGEAKPPVTWNDVVNDAKIITQQGAGVEYGLAYPMKQNGFFSGEVLNPFIASLGMGEWDYAHNKFNYASLEPAFTEYLLKVKKDESFVPGPEGLDNDSARALFADGKVGMKIAQSYDVAVYNDQFKAKCDWAVIDVPVLNPNVRYKTQAYLSSGLVVTERARPILDKATEVFKWFYGADLRTKMYENGKDLPYQESIIKNAKNVKDIRGWKEFSDLSKSYFVKERPYPPQGEGEDVNQVCMKIWLGVVKPGEALRDLDMRMTKELNSDIEKGKYKLEDYSVDNYDISVK